MSQTYMITHCETGDALTEGVQAEDVDRIAQSIADHRGEAVLVTPISYEDGERVDDDENAYVVEPTESDDNPEREVKAIAGSARVTAHGVAGGIDVDVIVNGHEGDVTLIPAADGSGYSSWGDPDHWVSMDLLRYIDTLDDKTRRDVLARLSIEAGAVANAA